jgi:hypothetical protein
MSRWMGRLLPVATVAIVALTVAPAGGAQPIDDACAGASPSAALCVGQQKLAEAAAAECRRLGLPASDCAVPIGHQVGDDIVGSYVRSWLHRAAAFQYRLGDPLSLGRAQWLGTHNSFNSVNDTLTPSHTDSNQQLSLVQQLDSDMRALELDLHWLPSAHAGGANAVVVCHGRGPDQANLGCTNERLFTEVLPELAGWLNAPAHRREVLLLYLENELDNAQGFAQSVQTLDHVLKRPDGSSLIYRPARAQVSAKGCAGLPLGLSRDAVRARGAQVVIVGNCRPGWASDVFGWDDQHVESGSTPRYRGFPACDATYARSVYDSKLVRYYEDSTFVSAAISPTTTPEEAAAEMLSPAKTDAMIDCGVNLFGFDQLLPHDGRIAESIWSWAKDQPRAASGHCTVQGYDARWSSRACGARRRAGCASATGWIVTTRAMRQTAAAGACRRLHARLALPRTGYENSLLRRTAGRGEVWLSYRLH